MTSQVDLSQRSPGFQKFMQGEQAREAAKTAKLLEPVQETIRQIHAEYRKAWRTELSKLSKADSHWYSANFVDLALPQTPADEDPKVTMQKVKTAYKEWFDTLPSRTGYVIDGNGSKRFQTFVQAQITFGNVSVTVESLDRMFQWFVDGDVFNESEIGYDPDLKTPELPKESAPLSMAEVLATTDTTTRDGNA